MDGPDRSPPFLGGSPPQKTKKEKKKESVKVEKSNSNENWKPIGENVFSATKESLSFWVLLLLVLKV